MAKTSIQVKSIDNLTAKQKIFCEEYVLDWNATRAAIVAGYSQKTARQVGSENLSKPYIKAYIEQVKENLEQVAGISRLRVLKEHMKIGFSSIAHMHDTWITRKDFESLTDEQKACVAEIDTKVYKKNIGTKKQPDIVEVEHVKIKLYDKQKALEAISKLMGYNEEKDKTTNIQVNNFNQFVDSLEDQYRKL